MSLLSRGASWLSEQRHANATVLVSYSRGGSSIDIDGTPQSEESQQVNEEGQLQRSRSEDWVFRVADLTLGLPRIGDRITRGSEVFEVMANGNDGPWRYTNSERIDVRVHVKRVAS